MKSKMKRDSNINSRTWQRYCGMPPECVDARMQQAICDGKIKEVRRIIKFRGLSHCREWLRGHLLLNIAITNNRTNIVKLFLQQNCKLNIKYYVSDSPLHLAAKNGDLPLIKSLLEHKAELNAQNGVGSTALSTAVQYNQASSVRFLLHRGASLKICDNNGESSLFKSVLGESFLTTSFPLDNDTCVCEKCQSKFVDSLRLDSNACVYEPSKPKRSKASLPTNGVYESCKPKNSETPSPTDSNVSVYESCKPNNSETLKSNIAISDNQYTITKLLLEQNANVNHKSKDNINPIYLSVEKGDEPMFTLHISYGGVADIHMKKEGKTIFHHAVINGNLLVVNHILEHCDFDQKDFKDLIEIAAESKKPNSVRIVNRLLKSKFPIGDYALHAAIKARNIQIAEILLQRGVRLNLNKNGNTSLFEAVKTGDAKMVALLISYGANDNHLLFSIVELLRPSYVRNNFKICEMIYEAGAAFNVSVNNYSTALSMVINLYLKRPSDGIVKENLQKHLMQLITADLPTNITSSHTDRCLQSCPGYKAECEIEVSMLKKERIGEGFLVSLYDVLVGSVTQVVCYVRRGNFQKYDQLFAVLKRKYPKYGGILYHKLSYSRNVSNVLDRFEVICRNMFSTLPELCVEKIMSFFSIEEIRQFLADS